MSDLTNPSHEECMVVSSCVMSLGSFLSSEEAERSRVALRESREIRGYVLVPGLPSLRSLTMITMVG